MTEIAIAKSADHAVPFRRITQVGRDFLIGLGLFALILLATTQLPDADARGRNQMFSSSAHAAPMLRIASEAPLDLQPSAIFRSTDRGEARTILGLAFASLVAFNLGVLGHLRRVYASPR
jgi:hypothetical protein